MGKSQARIRLNRFIAESGLTSRRKADRLIEEGRVMLNGKRVYEFGVQVNPETDRVTVDGTPIQGAEKKYHVLFFKPRNVVTTMSDPEGRPCVQEYFEDFPARIYPVGRLDWSTEGLLLLTNDGDFANRISHPKGEITKTYLVKTSGDPTDGDIEKLLAGVSTPVGTLKARCIDRVRRGGETKKWLRVVITEGKNHQIHHMFGKIGYDVEKLQREAIGQLDLGSLRRGEWRLLPEKALAKIFLPDKALERLQGKDSLKKSGARSLTTRSSKTATRRERPVEQKRSKQNQSTSERRRPF